MSEPTPSVPLLVRITDWIIQAFPRLLGALFIFTAIQKIRQPDSLRPVFAFDGLPPNLIQPAVWSIVGIELVLGILLLIFVYSRRTLLLATGCLLVIYIAQLVYLLLYSDAPACGCLGAEEGPNESKITNLMSLVRNLCLLWPVIWTWRQLSPARKKL